MLEISQFLPPNTLDTVPACCTEHKTQTSHQAFRSYDRGSPGCSKSHLGRLCTEGQAPSRLTTDSMGTTESLTGATLPPGGVGNLKTFGLSQLGNWYCWCLVGRGQGVPRMHRTARINELSSPKAHRAEDEKVTVPRMRDWGRCRYCFKPCPLNQLESPSPPQSGSCQLLYLRCLPSCPYPPGSAATVFLLVF